MSTITATNRIKTRDKADIVVNYHRDGQQYSAKDSVTLSIYGDGFNATLHLTYQEACDLQVALERTNSDIDEKDVPPEETARAIARLTAPDTAQRSNDE